MKLGQGYEHIALLPIPTIYICVSLGGPRDCTHDAHEVDIQICQRYLSKAYEER